MRYLVLVHVHAVPSPVVHTTSLRAIAHRRQTRESHTGALRSRCSNLALHIIAIPPVPFPSHNVPKQVTTRSTQPSRPPLPFTAVATHLTHVPLCSCTAPRSIQHHPDRRCAPLPAAITSPTSTTTTAHLGRGTHYAKRVRAANRMVHAPRQPCARAGRAVRAVQRLSTWAVHVCGAVPGEGECRRDANHFGHDRAGAEGMYMV